MATITYNDGRIVSLPTIEQAMMRVTREGFHFSENDDYEGAEPFFNEAEEQMGEVA